MKIESEKLLEKQLVQRINKVKGWSFKLLSTHVTGLPDRICLFPGGKIAFIEVKTTGKKPRIIQTMIHREIKKLGFRVEVIDSTEKIKKFMQDYE